MPSTTPTSLDQIYREYVQTILSHDLSTMDQYVAADVVHNDKPLGLSGYKDLLQRNIVDTRMSINIKRLVCDEKHVAAVLVFDVPESTKGFGGMQLNGRAFSYVENVVYDFEDGKIAEVHSLFDIDTVRAHVVQS